MATAARVAGVEVTVHEAEDMIHVWHCFAGVVPEVDDGIARVAQFVNKHAG